MHNVQHPPTQNNHRYLLWIMIAILLLGGALRIVGMTWSLPYQLHPDEPVLFINAWERWDTGSARLESQYPPLHLYTLVAQRGFIETVFGDDTPQVVTFFFGRWSTILTSLLLMAAAYALGKFLAGWRTGLALALFMTLEPNSVVDLGWLIKGDMLAWLLMLVTLGASFRAQRQRSWQWVGGALLWGLLATLTKYNMGLVLLAPLYVTVALITRRDWIAFLVVALSAFVFTFAIWQTVKSYWVSDISPAFLHCGGEGWEEAAISLGVDPETQTYTTLPCAPFRAFQQYMAPFYEGATYWSDTNQEVGRYVRFQMEERFGRWHLLLGIGLLGFGLWRGTLQPYRSQIALLVAILAACIYAFLMLKQFHPIRQYYVLLFGIIILLSLAIGQFKHPFAYVGLLLFFSVPTLYDNLQQRAELRQPDTRVETAEFLLDYARQGEAVIVEYDHVEFMAQYGGFPAGEGYFNILGTGGVYDYPVERLAEEGIYYVVADERGHTSTAARQNAEQFPPDDFALIYDLTSEDYSGPARRIYRTFRPEVEQDVQFGNMIHLAGYDLTLTDSTINLQLYWHSQVAHPPQYVLFVHLFDAESGDYMLGQDAQPDRTTPQWEQYEWIFDQRSIDLSELPTGEYIVRIGWYNPADGVRLPITNGVGDTWDLLHFELE